MAEYRNREIAPGPQYQIPSELHLPRGYRYGTANCRIRGAHWQRPDVAIIASDVPAVASVQLTRNAVKAAPIVACAALRARGAAGQAVIINSGNANACTGAAGPRAVAEMQAAAAQATGARAEDIWVMSTGVIGRVIPEGVFASAGTTALGADRAAVETTARAIMTTDRWPKLYSSRIGSSSACVLGFGKGAGMINPTVATMLVWLGTDAQLDQATADRALKLALDASLNRISVDGDQSTNDTVLLFANGASATTITSGPDFDALVAALTHVLQSIGKSIVRDGEGSNHCIELQISGARDDADAARIARYLSGSQLVKTAIFGHDPNWGRIAASVGAAQPELNPDKLRVRIGDIVVFEGGVPVANDRLKELSQYLATQEDMLIAVDLAMGNGRAQFWTSDLGYEYVRINADYTT